MRFALLVLLVFLLLLVLPVRLVLIAALATGIAALLLDWSRGRAA